MYQHIEIEVETESLDADKARTASVLNDFRNDQWYELISEEILKIDEVYIKTMIILLNLANELISF